MLFLSNNITALDHSINQISMSIVLPFLFPIMAEFEPFQAAVIALIGTCNLKKREKGFIWYKFLFNRMMIFITAGAASLCFRIVLGHTNTPVLAFLAATIIYFILNNGLVYLVIKSSGGSQNISFSYFTQLIKIVFISFFLGTVLYHGFLKFGKPVFLSALLFVYIIKDFLYAKIKMLNSITQLTESFLKIIDLKDHYTEGHCERVARYTETLCTAMGIKRTKAEQIVNIARIHDIGKINVSDEILKSSSSLTAEEYNEIKKHSLFGYQLLKNIDLMNNGLDILLHHHEHYDGKGYPEGKKGTDIPFGSRILAVCDAFDVMTYGRTYKPAMSKEEIIQELERCSSRQFDPIIAGKMIELINKGVFDDIFRAGRYKAGIS
jgi:HD-GYP domain-containing protein (c-di-GMP phosphodiesterase class II)